jgi:hypothetical protein
MGTWRRGSFAKGPEGYERKALEGVRWPGLLEKRKEYPGSHLGPGGN